MQKTSQQMVKDFIQQVWNEGKMENLSAYIHPDYTDHSLPGSFPANREGLKKWILLTSRSFEHQTVIEDQVTEGEKSVIKIKMIMKHIGEWRGIAATGQEVSTIGYRFYRIKDNKIIEHWGLIDGNALENKLREIATGCKII